MDERYKEMVHFPRGYYVHLPFVLLRSIDPLQQPSVRNAYLRVPDLVGCVLFCLGAPGFRRH